MKHCGKPWLSQPRLADCCAILSFRSPLRLTVAFSLRCRDRSSVDAAFDQQSPDDAGHLVGQSHGYQHFRFASQHLRKPRSLGRPAPAGLLNHGTRPNDQQAADRPFTAFRDGAEFCLPPVDFCSGVSPSQAAKSRPAAKPCAAGVSAAIAVATIGPTPGIVISRRAVGSVLERWLISASSTAICSSNAVKVSMSGFRMMRTFFGKEDRTSSTRATSVATGVMPCGKM